MIMRTPSGVAKQIREVVPKEHEEKFTRLLVDFAYKAPEQVLGCWTHLSSLCNELLGDVPLEEAENWQVEMIAILTDLEEADG